MTQRLLLPLDRAADSSSLSFLRDRRAAIAAHVNQALSQDVDEGTVCVTGQRARWYWRRLDWDSEYFGVAVNRLETAAWDESIRDPVEDLARVVSDLRAVLEERYESYYVFAELPSGDLAPLQALSLSGFRLVETRLTYFVPTREAIRWPERYPVRVANYADVAHLGEVAATARNPYDRYRADPFFGPQVADRYLATYAAESVRGLADFVLVPDPGDGSPPGAFFAANCSKPPRCPFGRKHACPLDISVGRIPLVAVSAARSGWHIRLLAETTRELTDVVEFACMTTQAANGAVIRNCEKLGYRLGRLTHIFAASRGVAA